MIDSELLQAIRILSIKAVEDPDSTDVYARICRWYSREFSTPLTQVEDLDPTHVLKHYFEDMYGKLYTSDSNDAQHKYDDMRQELLFPEDYKARADKDDEWVRKLEAEVAAERKKAEQNQDNNNTTMAEKMVEKMAAKLSDGMKKAVEELNLKIPEDMELPDSGSFGEE